MNPAPILVGDDDATCSADAAAPATAIGATHAEARYFDLARVCDQPVIVCTGGLVRYVNDATVAALAAGRPGDVIARPLTDFVELDALVETDDDGPADYVEVALKRHDGSTSTISIVWTHCTFEGRDGIQVVMRDIAARRALEHQLQFLARHDSLTGIPNRGEFHERLVGAIARATRMSRVVAVMGINVDRLRDVNAMHGHAAGDRVLQAVAARIAQSIRQGDSAARIGGDHFALILEGMEQRAQAAVVAGRILDELRQPINVGSHFLSVTASAGVAAAPIDATDGDALLRQVDGAMYAAKAAGGDGFRFWFPGMEAMPQKDDARRKEVIARVDALTPRELEVMDMLVDGRTNRAIGQLLGASPRTIEIHRSRVMTKMHAASLPDLVRMALEVRRVL